MPLRLDVLVDVEGRTSQDDTFHLLARERMHQEVVGESNSSLTSSDAAVDDAVGVEEPGVEKDSIPAWDVVGDAGVDDVP